MNSLKRIYVKRIRLLDRRCEHSYVKLNMFKQGWPLWHLELQLLEAFLHGHLKALQCLHLQADSVEIPKEAFCITSVWPITISGTYSLDRRMTGQRSNWLRVYSTERLHCDVSTRYVDSLFPLCRITCF